MGKPDTMYVRARGEVRECVGRYECERGVVYWGIEHFKRAIVGRCSTRGDLNAHEVKFFARMRNTLSTRYAHAGDRRSFCSFYARNVFFAGQE